MALVLDIQYPSPTLVFTLVLASYFVVTAGIAYDIINEPPAIGAVTDPKTGKVRPQAFMPYRMSGQYIMEGLCGAMFYLLGGIGLVLLDMAQSPKVDRITRSLCRTLGALLSVISFCTVIGFIRIKMPSYLVWY